MRTKRAQNAANGGLDLPKLVWRPGSARTRWGGAYSDPPDLLAINSEGRGGMGERGREGGESRDGKGRDGEGRDRPAHFLVASAAYGPDGNMHGIIYRHIGRAGLGWVDGQKSPVFRRGKSGNPSCIAFFKNVNAC